MLISEKMYLYRKSKGLTQENMAGGVISVAALSRIERNASSVFADDLIKILYSNEISILEFLQEYSSAGDLIKYYQEQAMYYFINKDKNKLVHLYKNLNINSKLLNVLLQEMIGSLNGEEPSEGAKVKSLLFRLKDYSEKILWYLEVSLRLYKNEDFSVLTERVFRKFSHRKLDKHTQKIIADISVIILKEKTKCSIYLKKQAEEFLGDLDSEKDVFLEKLAGQYLLAKNNQDSEKVVWISYQVSFLGLEDEFLQLVD